MSATEWAAFEKAKRPVGMPWLDVSSSTTPFNPAVLVLGPTEPTTFEIRRAPARHLTEIANTLVMFEPKAFHLPDALILANAFQDVQDIDRSPIRAFLRERITRARSAAMDADSAGYPMLAARINELIGLAEMDWPDVEIPSGQAIASLIRVIAQLGTMNLPGLTLSDRGQIWAEWSNASGRVALIVGAEGVPAIAALLPDRGTFGRQSHFNFHGSEEEVACRLNTDPELRPILAP